MRILLIVIFFLFFSTLKTLAQPRPLEGDLIFQTSQSSQSQAVQEATRSTYSHMGVILIKKDVPCVFEAISTVQCTPLKKWIARGKGGQYKVKRLKSRTPLESATGIEQFRDVAETFAGRQYDLTFEWSDTKIYCSELVWKIYQKAFGLEIGKLSKLSDFNLSSPAVRQKIWERYSGNPPLEEKVISPEAMFNSPLLIDVTYD